MGKRKATQQDYDDAYKEHGRNLRRYIRPYMEDKDQAEKILHIILWEIPLIKQRPGGLGEQLYKINDLARKIALAFQQSDTTFDKWAAWKKEPDFYRLDDPAITQRHKAVFNYLYYRDISFKEAAGHFKVPLEEIITQFREVTNAISESYRKRIADCIQPPKKARKKETSGRNDTTHQTVEQ